MRVRSCACSHILCTHACDLIRVAGCPRVRRRMGAHMLDDYLMCRPTTTSKLCIYGKTARSPAGAHKTPRNDYIYVCMRGGSLITSHAHIGLTSPLHFHITLSLHRTRCRHTHTPRARQHSPKVDSATTATTAARTEGGGSTSTIQI